jgi:RNA polymerase sigma-70 factor (family 1)
MLSADEIMLLLGRIANHKDEAALKQLFDEFYPRLLLFAQSILKNKPVAEEVVEDVFIKLWENKASLPFINSLPAYLFRATKNNVLNYQRLTKNQSYIDIDDIKIELTAGIRNPEELFISSEMVHRINAAIALLPPKCQLIFKLVKEDGLKYKEVAELLTISIKTVENQMSYALKKISKALITPHTGNLPPHTKK